MRYAVVSDIHGNLHALEAVLEDIREQVVDNYICLGDIVGYGAYPEECVTRIRDLGFTSVAGNHDYAVLGKISIEHFNTLAKTTTLWTRENLTSASLDYLDGMPLVQELGHISVVHGSYYSPELFDYVQTSYDAYLSLSKMHSQICFIGHSHIPVTFLQNPFVTYTMSPEVEVPKKGKVLVNVGSVGQPRDQNPKACYAVYDDDESKIWIRRIPYDVEAATGAISEKGLPTILGDRLKIGR